MSLNKKAYIVPHTHWDREWYFSTEESQVLLVFTMQQVLEQLEQDEDLPCFVLDGQSVMLEDYLSVVPEDKARIEALVQQDKLLVGPWYTQTDQCVVHGESQLRNLYWGNADAMKFGAVMKVGYVPDSFGQSAQLPQLLQHFDIDKCVFWRGIWEGISPNTEFSWQAPDGSKVTTAVLEFGYSAFQGMKPMQLHLDGLDQSMESPNWQCSREHFLFMGGHDQKPWQRKAVSAINQANQERDYNYQLCDFDEYFTAVANQPLATVQSEMLYGKYSRIHRGIYSTRYDIKKLNSDVENLLINQLEPLLTVGTQMGLHYPYGLMEKNWKQLMQSHAHDSIGCCNTDPVNQQVKARIQAVKENAERLKDITLKQLADAATGDQQGEYIMIFNPLPVKRTTNIELDLVLPTRQFALCDQGKEADIQSLDCQLVDINSIVQDPTTLGDERFKSWYRHRVIAKLEALPPCGYRFLTIERLPDGDADQVALTKPESNRMLGSNTISGNMISNDLLTVSVACDGKIALTKHATNEHWDDLLTLVDGGDDGDNYDFSEPYNDLKVNFCQTPVAVSVVHGALRSQLEVTYRAKLPLNLAQRADQLTTVDQDITMVLSLEKDAHQVDIDIQLDNQIEDHRLQLHINGDFLRSETIADQPIGLIRRGDDAEALAVWQQQGWTSAPVPIYPMQSLVAAETAKGGLAVFTDGIREYQQYPDTVAITLFRSVGYVGKPELKYRPGRLSGLPDASPDSQLKEPLAFRLAVYPFDGDAMQAELCSQVKQWLSKPLSLHNGVIQRFMIAPPRFTAPQNFSLFALDNPGLAISAIKQAENDSNAIIVRVINAADKPVALGRLTGAWQVDIADGMEHSLRAACERDEVLPHSLMALRLTPRT
ncbi:sugar hydrolase [Photobacterium sp. SDRW27]|uniref:glycoside hydrolase family 38 N-terminal domain-containing protein n=1 Tax=Photobacterium obscurum TaxID=2829490 RepID=UPI0022432F70|nr:glycoside hydrolase family 38 C-terminal domain-containing protein [Photobacterium obscurum]MCW8331031.1 sugar hydrolase [Photobacterium obscurum]